jgi:hypothetical protein
LQTASGPPSSESHTAGKERSNIVIVKILKWAQIRQDKLASHLAEELVRNRHIPSAKKPPLPQTGSFVDVQPSNGISDSTMQQFTSYMQPKTSATRTFSLIFVGGRAHPNISSTEANLMQGCAQPASPLLLAH